MINFTLYCNWQILPCGFWSGPWCTGQAVWREQGKSTHCEGTQDTCSSERKCWFTLKQPTLCLCLSVYLFASFFFFLCLCLSVCLSVCLSLSLSLSLSLFLSLSLTHSLSLSLSLTASFSCPFCNDMPETEVHFLLIWQKCKALRGELIMSKYRQPSMLKSFFLLTCTNESNREIVYLCFEISGYKNWNSCYGLETQQ